MEFSNLILPKLAARTIFQFCLPLIEKFRNFNFIDVFQYFFNQKMIALSCLFFFESGTEQAERADQTPVDNISFVASSTKVVISYFDRKTRIDFYNFHM